MDSGEVNVFSNSRKMPSDMPADPDAINIAAIFQNGATAVEDVEVIDLEDESIFRPGDWNNVSSANENISLNGVATPKCVATSTSFMTSAIRQRTKGDKGNSLLIGSFNDQEPVAGLNQSKINVPASSKPDESDNIIEENIEEMNMPEADSVLGVEFHTPKNYTATCAANQIDVSSDRSLVDQAVSIMDFGSRAVPIVKDQTIGLSMSEVCDKSNLPLSGSTKNRDQPAVEIDAHQESALDKDVIFLEVSNRGEAKKRKCSSVECADLQKSKIKVAKYCNTEEPNPNELSPSNNFGNIIQSSNSIDGIQILSLMDATASDINIVKKIPNDYYESRSQMDVKKIDVGTPQCKNDMGNINNAVPLICVSVGNTQENKNGSKIASVLEGKNTSPIQVNVTEPHCSMGNLETVSRPGCDKVLSLPTGCKTVVSGQPVVSLDLDGDAPFLLEPKDNMDTVSEVIEKIISEIENDGNGNSNSIGVTDCEASVAGHNVLLGPSSDVALQKYKGSKDTVSETIDYVASGISWAGKSNLINNKECMPEISRLNGGNAYHSQSAESTISQGCDRHSSAGLQVPGGGLLSMLLSAESTLTNSNDHTGPKKKKKPKNNMSKVEAGWKTRGERPPGPLNFDPALSRPFHYGWKREIVSRNPDVATSKSKDVYYFAPCGKKLRSNVKVEEYLLQKGITNVTKANFTFRPVLVSNSEHEITRHAQPLKNLVKKIPSNTPTGSTSVRPKVTKSDKSKTVAATSIGPVDWTIAPVDEQLPEHSDKPIKLKIRRNSIEPVAQQVILKPEIQKTYNRRKQLLQPRSCTNNAKQLLVSRLHRPVSPPRLFLNESDSDSSDDSDSDLVDLVSDDDVVAASVMDDVTNRDMTANIRSKVGNGRSLCDQVAVADNTYNRGKAVTVGTPKVSNIVRENKFVTVDICSVHCNGRGGAIPTLQCITCFCLFHPLCVGVSEATGSIMAYVCKQCGGRSLLVNGGNCRSGPTTENNCTRKTVVQTMKNSVNLMVAPPGNALPIRPMPHLTAKPGVTGVQPPPRQSLSNVPYPVAMFSMPPALHPRPPPPIQQLLPLPRLRQVVQTQPPPTPSPACQTTLPPPPMQRVQRPPPTLTVGPRPPSLQRSPVANQATDPVTWATESEFGKMTAQPMPQLTAGPVAQRRLDQLSPSHSAAPVKVSQGISYAVVTPTTPCGISTFVMKPQTSSPATLTLVSLALTTPTTSFSTMLASRMLQIMATKVTASTTMQPGASVGTIISSQPVPTAAVGVGEGQVLRDVAVTNVASPPCLSAETSSQSNVEKCLPFVFRYFFCSDLIRMSRVCRTWRDIAGQPDQWNRVCLKNIRIRDWEKFVNILERNNTQCLDLRGMWMHDDKNRTWHEFASELPRLKRLQRLYMCEVPAPVVHTVANALTELEGFAAESIVESTRGQGTSHCRIFVAHFSVLTALRILKIRGSYGLHLPNFANSEGIGNLSCLTKLTCLCLTSMKGVNPNDFNFLPQLTNLTVLELGDCTDWTMETYRTIGKMSQLKHLRLEFGGQHALEGPCEALRNLNCLNHLEMIMFPISSELTSVFAGLSALRTVCIWPDLKREAASTNVNMLAALRALPRLRNFTYCLVTSDLSSTASSPFNHLSRCIPFPADTSDVEVVGGSLNADELLRKLRSSLVGCKVKVVLTSTTDYNVINFFMR